MTTAKKIVLLTLVGAVQFRRRDLKGADGVTAEIRKGQVIAVTEDMADKLTDEQYGTHDADNDYRPYFKPADDDAKVDHDFTVPYAERIAAAQRTVSHDLESLPKTDTLSGANIPKRTQRTARSAS